MLYASVKSNSSDKQVQTLRNLFCFFSPKKENPAHIAHPDFYRDKSHKADPQTNPESFREQKSTIFPNHGKTAIGTQLDNL